MRKLDDIAYDIEGIAQLLDALAAADSEYVGAYSVLSSSLGRISEELMVYDKMGHK